MWQSQRSGGGSGPAVLPQAIASGAIPSNSIAYVKGDGKLGLADATAEGKEAAVFVHTGVADAAAASFYGSGSVIEGLSGLVTGTDYYMTTTPGAFSATPPSGAVGSGIVVQKIGRAMSTTALLFAPSTPITL